MQNPSEPTGSMGDVFFGAWTGNTDGTDTDPNLDWGDEAGSGPALPMPGIAARFTGTGGWFDFKAPFTGTESKVYTLTTFEVGGEITDPVSLYFTADWPEATEYNPPYSIGGVDYQYTFEGPMVPGVSQTFTSDDPMPANWTWTGSLGDELTITVSPRETYGRQSGGETQQDSGDGAVDQTDSGGGMSMLTATVGTIAWAKGFADATTLDNDLAGKVVSRTFPSQDYYYIQEPTGECGIRVSDATNASIVLPGDLITIPSGTAQITTVDGERVIDSPQTAVGDPSTEPKPWGMTNKSLGGGAFGSYTSGPVDGIGLNNVGQLVRAWGKVTSVGTDYFYVDDGSKVTDGTGVTGVRVAGVNGYLPAVNDYVAMTGISGLATYATSLARTVRLARSSDLSGICPPLPPSNLTAVSTGSGKITLYWDGSPGATGYNIYRGATSGGENYAAPVNGATPVNTPSYTGSSIYIFTDTGLTDGTEYFYTVKAVAGCGESQPSNESSAVPASGNIPWDTGDPSLILPAIRNAFPDVSIPAGTLRSCGPDGRIYEEGTSTALPPDATVDPSTRDVIFPDGTIITLPADEAEEGSGMGILSVTFPNAQSGPFRKVRTRSTASYRGAKGRFGVPDSSISIHHSPYTYPNGKSTKDIPYLYLGGLGNGHEIDAGIYYGPTQQDPSGRWRMFMKIDKKWVNTPRGGVFDDNQDLNVRFSVSQNVDNQVLLQVTPVGGTAVTLTQHATGFPKTANGVRIKRVHSIAQNSLRGADLQRGYRMTGSYFEASEWHDGYIQNQAGGFDWWGTSQTTSSDEGSYPAKGPIVDWYLVNFTSQLKRYADEINVNIHL